MDIISNEIVHKRSIRNSKMISGNFLEKPRESEGSVMHGNKVDQQEEGKCSQELLINNSLST